MTTALKYHTQPHSSLGVCEHCKALCQHVADAETTSAEMMNPRGGKAVANSEKNLAASA